MPASPAVVRAGDGGRRNRTAGEREKYGGCSRRQAAPCHLSSSFLLGLSRQDIKNRTSSDRGIRTCPRLAGFILMACSRPARISAEKARSLRFRSSCAWIFGTSAGNSRMSSMAHRGASG